MISHMISLYLDGLPGPLLSENGLKGSIIKPLFR